VFHNIIFSDLYLVYCMCVSAHTASRDDEMWRLRCFTPCGHVMGVVNVDGE